MKRLSKGQWYKVTFYDHCHDRDEIATQEAAGRLAEISDKEIVLHSWYSVPWDPNEDLIENGLTKFRIVRSCIERVSKLAEVDVWQRKDKPKKRRGKGSSVETKER